MHYRYLTIEQRESLEQLIRAQPQSGATLERLHTPDYGVCAACGRDIPFVRLMLDPAAVYCPACQPRSLDLRSACDAGGAWRPDSGHGRNHVSARD